jgi:hypothetical protein
MEVSGWFVAGLAVAVVLLTSLFKNVEWSDKVKNLVAVVFSVVGGAVSVWLSGGFDGAVDVLQTSLLVYGASQLLYAFILKGTTPEAALANVSVFGGSAVDVPEDTEVVDEQTGPDEG